eukprot:TRINITY_DN26838_c0_g1_i1.p1 TRINITY_DN26838_c0_g1~~TRINITY_DN26838_c0_g1_i1.p1  ORF type:complete len:119 (+),score=3.44 TRINITY_DN26838_c0_g1_i1:517-873(+)
MGVSSMSGRLLSALPAPLKPRTTFSAESRKKDKPLSDGLFQTIPSIIAHQVKSRARLLLHLILYLCLHSHWRWNRTTLENRAYAAALRNLGTSSLVTKICCLCESVRSIAVPEPLAAA